MLDKKFTEACATVMPFGKYQGKTLARIGSNDEGLKYLDWLRDEGIRIPGIRIPALREAVATYLDHPAVARQLDAALED